jgi:inorganic pyrophosphatase
MDVVIETPKGSAQKYDYDPDTGFFKLSKILPSGMVFPYDFGFIPGTQGEDGDPLDIIVISEFCSFAGCMIDCRIIGGFVAEQSKESGSKKMIRNDRFLAVPKCSNAFSEIKTSKDLPEKIMQELGDFFIDYNKIQDKKFVVLDKVSPKGAEKIIKKGKKK